MMLSSAQHTHVVFRSSGGGKVCIRILVQHMSKNSDYAYKTILHPELIKGLLDSHSSENGAWRLHIDEAINDNNEMLYEEFVNNK